MEYIESIEQARKILDFLAKKADVDKIEPFSIFASNKHIIDVNEDVFLSVVPKMHSWHYRLISGNDFSRNAIIKAKVDRSKMSTDDYLIELLDKMFTEAKHNDINVVTGKKILSKGTSIEQILIEMDLTEI